MTDQSQSAREMVELAERLELGSDDHQTSMALRREAATTLRYAAQAAPGEPVNAISPDILAFIQQVATHAASDRQNTRAARELLKRMSEPVGEPQTPGRPHGSDFDFDEIDGLVGRFSAALREKLYAAEAKYGHNSGWMRDDWKADCQRALCDHLAKGDPRDVAIYCAFMWHHGWPSTPLTCLSDESAGVRECREALEAAERLIEEALPKFNWAKSVLDANAIRLLNETPGKIKGALALLRTESKG